MLHHMDVLHSSLTALGDAGPEAQTEIGGRIVHPLLVYFNTLLHKYAPTSTITVIQTEQPQPSTSGILTKQTTGPRKIAMKPTSNMATQTQQDEPRKTTRDQSQQTETHQPEPTNPGKPSPDPEIDAILQDLLQGIDPPVGDLPQDLPELMDIDLMANLLPPIPDDLMTIDVESICATDCDLGPPAEPSEPKQENAPEATHKYGLVKIESTPPKGRAGPKVTLSYESGPTPGTSARTSVYTRLKPRPSTGDETPQALHRIISDQLQRAQSEEPGSKRAKTTPIILKKRDESQNHL